MGQYLLQIGAVITNYGSHYKLRPNNIEVGVLIGLDHYWDIVIGNLIRDTQNLVALETKLGHILSGPVYTEIHRNNSVAAFFANVAFNQEKSFKEELHKFWSLESLGIIDKETV